MYSPSGQAASDHHPSILLIVDDADLHRLLRKSLSGEHYHLSEADTAVSGLAQVETLRPDLILLEFKLARTSSIDVIRHVRRQKHGVPIVVVSAHSNVRDRIAALDAGADDFVSKPFSIGEFQARLRVALRRAAATPAHANSRMFRAGHIEVDFERRKVRVAGREVHLTPREYRLLQLLIHNADRVLTHSHLLRKAWTSNKKRHAHHLRVFMLQLRKKLEVDPARPRHLRTEPGVGYRFQTDS
ncbi:MAG TPA: response regulator [Terriglobia bacterium]|nr:response regulator [Terriglobia bacterium]